MIKKLKVIINSLFNFSIFISFCVLIYQVLYSFFGHKYINGPPIGGDYYNALTFLAYYQKYNPLPISAWLPFWYEGTSAIGSYPPLTFYLINLLNPLQEPIKALNNFSFISLYLFLIASLALFWQVSKSWIFASALFIILLISQSTYYQLMAGGFIVSASTQWYLPFVLFLIFRFGEKLKDRYFILAALFSGLSMLHQGPSGFLMTFLPSIAVLTFQKFANKKSRLKHIFFYAGASLLIGTPGLYSVIIKALIGSGAGFCTNIECWGVYPKHLITWMNAYPVVIIFFLFIVLLIINLIRKKTDLHLVIPSTAGLLIPILYLSASYLKLINSLSVVIFPTRIFWVVNIFLLLISASIFYAIRKSSLIVSVFVSTISLLLMTFLALSNTPVIKTELPNVIPQNVTAYLPNNFQTRQLSDLVPLWLNQHELNWRIDIYNQGIYHWWNSQATTPTVRGYFNHLPNNDWQYYLDIVSRQDPASAKITKINQTYYLFDAYGIKYIENSQSSIPNSILNSPNIVNRQVVRDLEWLELDQEQTNPIIHPTNSPAVLFIGNNEGYNNFVKVLAINNLNSKYLIPIKGPSSLDRISTQDLDNFKAVILYQYSKNDLKKLNGYIKKGGAAFIETGSLRNPPKDKLEQTLPIEKVQKTTVSGPSNFKAADDTLLKNVDLNGFSPLDFRGEPWAISRAESLRPWAKPVLDYGENHILAMGENEKGKIVWSGLNLLFHIVENENFQEAQLFKNILTYLTGLHSQNPPAFQINRDNPSNIKIKTDEFQGIYFKENFDSGWTAKINGQKAKIYEAGLGFMFIPNSQSSNPNPTVELTFEGNLTSKLIFFTSVFTIFWSLLTLSSPRFFYFLFSKFTKTLKTLGKSIKYLDDEQ